MLIGLPTGCPWTPRAAMRCASHPAPGSAQAHCASALSTRPASPELCRLADDADDKVSLAIGMAGHVAGLAYRAHYRESSRLASEFTRLIESIGDPVLTVSLLGQAAFAKHANGEITEAVRLAERVIELADGDPRMGQLLIESPLAHAVMTRAAARAYLGASGWRQDMDRAAAMCREFLPIGQAVMLVWKYVFGIVAGAVLPDATAVAEHPPKPLNSPSSRAKTRRWKPPVSCTAMSWLIATDRIEPAD